MLVHGFMQTVQNVSDSSTTLPVKFFHLATLSSREYKMVVMCHLSKYYPHNGHFPYSIKVKTKVCCAEHLSFVPDPTLTRSNSLVNQLEFFELEGAFVTV